MQALHKKQNRINHNLSDLLDLLQHLYFLICQFLKPGSYNSFDPQITLFIFFSFFCSVCFYVESNLKDRAENGLAKGVAINCKQT